MRVGARARVRVEERVGVGVGVGVGVSHASRTMPPTASSWKMGGKACSMASHRIPRETPCVRGGEGGVRVG